VTVLPHKMVFAGEVVLALEEALKDSGLLNP
jgi:hypothetical protein